MKWLLSFLMVALLLGCAEKRANDISIAINPWPGYELIHLAQDKGYFDEVGLNIRLEELSSLADAQRAFMNGRVDGFTSTIVEAMQAHIASGYPLKIIFVTDYSNGGDVMMAAKDIESVPDLKGKTVGAEVASLGIVVLITALEKYGLSLDDVTVVNVEQLNGYKSLKDGVIDAFVTYPPESLKILADENYHQIFSTAEIPGEVVDVVSVSEKVLSEQPEFVEKFVAAWQKAYDFTKQNPDVAFAHMAERQGLSQEDFTAIFEQDLNVFSGEEGLAILKSNKKLRASLLRVCETLKSFGHLKQSCDDSSSALYLGPGQ